MQRAEHQSLYDIDLQTGATIEVFYAARTLETFGMYGAGWFWWPRRRGCSPGDVPTGPFATSYAAYRHAMNTTGPLAASRHRNSVSCFGVRTQNIGVQ